MTTIQKAGLKRRKKHRAQLVALADKLLVTCSGTDQANKLPGFLYPLSPSLPEVMV